MTGTSTAEGPSFADDSAALARDYEEVSRQRQFVAGRRLVAALAIAAGERVLDVGCGTGLLAEHVADLVGPGGAVLGIDPLPERIALAAAKARATLRFEVGDAADLSGHAEGSFDVVLLNAVFHWLPDKAGPLREFRRVLRPGGRLGIGGTTREQRSPLAGVMREVLARPPFAAHPRPRRELSFRIDADEMRRLLAEAGYADIAVTVLDARYRHPSAEAAMRYAESSSFGNLLAHLPAALRPAARAALAAGMAANAAPDGSLEQTGQRMIALAVKPG
ncbi:MAG: methyltransferase domain-containing protein [Reyranellaceae bacterium]